MDFLTDPFGAAVDLFHNAHRPPEAATHGDAAREAPPITGGPLGMLNRGIADFGRGLFQEGLTGLLDPAGMIDRQEAQRELAGRFHVRAPGEAVDPHAAGNNVSEEEFERISRQFSDIRRGRTDLNLDTAGMDPAEAAAFRQATMGDVGDILQTSAGRELIGGLANQTNHHTTTIHRRADNTNAEGGSEVGAVPGSWADGTGTNAAVTYSPGAAGGIVPPGMTAPWLPMRSDVTLFHELTHAHHAAYGTLDQTTLASGAGVNPDDVGQLGMEYQAVGLGGWAGNTLTENTYGCGSSGTAET